MSDTNAQPNQPSTNTLNTLPMSGTTSAAASSFTMPPSTPMPLPNQATDQQALVKAQETESQAVDSDWEKRLSGQSKVINEQKAQIDALQAQLASIDESMKRLIPVQTEPDKQPTLTDRVEQMQGLLTQQAKTILDMQTREQQAKLDARKVSLMSSNPATKPYVAIADMIATHEDEAAQLQAINDYVERISKLVPQANVDASVQTNGAAPQTPSNMGIDAQIAEAQQKWDTAAMNGDYVEASKWQTRYLALLADQQASVGNAWGKGGIPPTLTPAQLVRGSGPF